MGILISLSSLNHAQLVTIASKELVVAVQHTQEHAQLDITVL
jgi:hypothetical protein